MVRIQVGDVLVDVDNSTRVGFKYTSGWLGGPSDNEKSRTFDLSVPATPKNAEVFAWSGNPAQRGQRRGMEATMMTGGVHINGLLFVTGWGGGRFSLLFVFGDAVASLDGNRPQFLDTTELDKVSEPIQVGGKIPNFGFYSYENNAANVGTFGDYLDRMPVVNLGYLLDGYATAAGYTINWPAVSGFLSPYTYGLVLPTCTVDDWATVTVTGSPSAAMGLTATVTGGGGTLASVGLQLRACWYRRGTLNTRHLVMVFEALSSVTIRPTSNDAAFVGGEGYEVLSGGEIYSPHDNEFQLQAGEWFTVVAPSDAHRNIFGVWHWHQFSGYTGAVNVGFDVLLSTSTPTTGMTIELQDNLPDMTLKEGLNAFCDIIGAVFSIDETSKMVTVESRDGMLASGSVAFDLDAMRVIETSEVKDYIDGWSQHNYTRCKSEDYVQEHERFKRDWPVENEYLEKEREIGVIPWNEGGIIYGISAFPDAKLAYFDDVTIPAGDASVEYKGVLSVIVESPAGCPALHLQTVIDAGVGTAFGRFTRFTRQVVVRVEMPMFLFLSIKNTTFAHKGCTDYVISAAEWSDGVARLTLLAIDADPLDV